MVLFDEKILNHSESIIGITHAGRSIEIEDIDELNGMFSTVLPLRVTQGDLNEINFTKITSDIQKIVTVDAVSLEDLNTNSKLINVNYLTHLLSLKTLLTQPMLRINSNYQIIKVK